MSERTGEDRNGPAPTPAWWRRWTPHLPTVPDVLDLLGAQGDVTAAGMDAFVVWSRDGEEDSADAVRSCADRAFQARRKLLSALQAALSTPVDQEDLYILSERIDRVLNQARQTVREAEVLGWSPDANAATMARRLADGTEALVAGCKLLRHDGKQAGTEADTATSTVHKVEHDYREAMRALLEIHDLRAVLTAQGMYRRYLGMAEAIIAVADRWWYAVLRGA